MKLNIRVLGSSSAGNCTIMWDSKSAIMIDCGFPASYITEKMNSMGIDISFLSGVFITHTHGDHVNRSMMRLLNRARIPVYCHHNIRHDLAKKYVTMDRGHNAGYLVTYTDEEISSGEFAVKGFEVPHDSVGGCFGYNIYKSLKSGNKKITISTDMGYPQEDLTCRFADSDVIVIESNHDIDMLENSGRPRYLIDRIKKIGHLSNEQCAEFLLDILGRSTKLPEAVVLAHISQQCNTGELAFSSTLNALLSRGHNTVRVVLTHKLQVNEIVCLE